MGPERSREAVGPRPLLLGVVGLGTDAVGVVGDVVVVPQHRQRVGGVHGLEVGVEAGLGVTGAVVRQGHRLVRRLRLPARQTGLHVLVDVVAEVEDQVDVGGGERPVDGKGRCRVAGAARDTQPQPVGGAGRQRAGPPGRRVLAAGLEAVPVRAPRVEAVDVDRHRPGVGVDVHLAGGHRDDHVGVAGHDPAHVPPTPDEGPKQHAISERVEAGHPVPEPALGALLRFRSRAAPQRHRTKRWRDGGTGHVYPMADGAATCRRRESDAKPLPKGEAARRQRVYAGDARGRSSAG